MTYLILITPLIITVALSAICMKKLTFLMQIRHFSHLKPPVDKDVFYTPSLFFNRCFYYDSREGCMSGISELPFDIETIKKFGDEEISALCRKRRKISKMMRFVLIFTILSIPSYFVYQILTINS